MLLHCHWHCHCHIPHHAAPPRPALDPQGHDSNTSPPLDTTTAFLPDLEAAGFVGEEALAEMQQQLDAAEAAAAPAAASPMNLQAAVAAAQQQQLPYAILSCGTAVFPDVRPWKVAHALRTHTHAQARHIRIAGSLHRKVPWNRRRRCRRAVPSLNLSTLSETANTTTTTIKKPLFTLILCCFAVVLKMLYGQQMLLLNFKGGPTHSGKGLRKYCILQTDII